MPNGKRRTKYEGRLRDATNRLAAGIAVSRDKLYAHQLQPEPISEPFDPRGFHVYLLWKDDEVVYVGQSTNVFARLGDHFGGEKRSVVTAVQLIRCVSRESMSEIEAAAIQFYQPLFNTRGK